MKLIPYLNGERWQLYFFTDNIFFDVHLSLNKLLNFVETFH